MSLLLRKSARLQEDISEVFARVVFTSDVVAALEADDSLTPAKRHRAIRRARAMGDDGLRLNRDSWGLVRSAGCDAQSYRIGLRGAEAASALEPENIDFVSTLGMAQYRNRRYDDAYKTLTRSDQLRRAQGHQSDPRDVAGLTMALFRLGRIEEAQVSLERFEKTIKDPEVGWRYISADANALLAECQQLLRGSDVLTGSLDKTMEWESREAQDPRAQIRSELR
jgi:hypothetical protein